METIKTKIFFFLPRQHPVSNALHPRPACVQHRRTSRWKRVTAAADADAEASAALFRLLPLHARCEGLFQAIDIDTRGRGGLCVSDSMRAVDGWIP